LDAAFRAKEGRQMETRRLTPLDIESKEFPSSFRGYSTPEVRAFLEKIAMEFESLLREIRGLEARVAELKRERDELRNRESLINETLVAAQASAEQILEAAREKASAILQQAETERTHLVAQIEELRAEREAFVVQLRSFLDAFYARLEETKRKAAG
jgi:cell division initiation protein